MSVLSLDKRCPCIVYDPPLISMHFAELNQLHRMSQIIQCTYLHTAQFYGSHRHPRPRPRSVILQCGGVEKCHEGNLKSICVLRFRRQDLGDVSWPTIAVSGV